MVAEGVAAKRLIGAVESGGGLRCGRIRAAGAVRCGSGRPGRSRLKEGVGCWPEVRVEGGGAMVGRG